METSSHPTVAGLMEAIQNRNGKLVCHICGRDEFVLDEVAVMGAGRQEGYGAHRLRRAQLVCENCGCVTSFDLDKLR